jgi:glycosyl transferase family 87
VHSFIQALDRRARSIGRRGLIVVNAGLAIGFGFSAFSNLAKPGSALISDFTVFWTGWTLILAGRASALYDEAAQRITQQSLLHGMHFEGGLMAFLNPPHAALAGAPVGWLANQAGEQVAFVVWSAGVLALIAVFVHAVCDEWGGTRPQRWMIAAAVLAFHPVFCAVKQGQTSVLLALGVLGLYRAVKSGNGWTGGAWLLVLTIKPQLVPMLVVYLAARRCWRVLWCGAVLVAGAVALTTAILGPAVWLEYAGQVRHLERFWGTGTPEYMLNVRGVLTRMFGFGGPVWIDAASNAGWLLTMAITGSLLMWRRDRENEDLRPAYAFTVAMMLVSNPHMFVHDASIWIVPLLLCATAMRDAGSKWQRFGRFALLWPLLFAVGGLVDVKSAHLTLVDPRIWSIAAAAFAIASCWLATTSDRRASDHGQSPVPSIDRGWTPSVPYPPG